MCWTYKSITRKLLSAKEGSVWADWIGEVNFAMNSLTSRAHGFSPFRLVYKQEPMFPIYLTRLEAPPEYNQAGDLDYSATLEREMLDELERRWREDLPEVINKLATTDKQMKREYMQRHQLKELGVPYHFQAGDAVIVR